jgi:hypothetical protein
MKKQHKITAPERDQIAWWLACGITIREMARRLGRSPCKDTQLPDTLRSFYSYTKGAGLALNLGPFMYQKGPFLRQLQQY